MVSDFDSQGKMRILIYTLMHRLCIGIVHLKFCYDPPITQTLSICGPLAPSLPNLSPVNPYSLANLKSINYTVFAKSWEVLETNSSPPLSPKRNTFRPKNVPALDSLDESL
jgi:hypothetical protein